jgi:hypothetical protein
VATIGVVGWIGSQGGQPVPAAVVAKTPVAAPAVQPVVNRVEPAPDVQEYLSAHRQIPSAELYRTVTNRTPAAPATAR